MHVIRNQESMVTRRQGQLALHGGEEQLDRTWTWARWGKPGVWLAPCGQIMLLGTMMASSGKSGGQGEEESPQGKTWRAAWGRTWGKDFVQCND